ncbi:leucine-rich repeat-containing protein 15-like [Littorina saxatilis]|uniref:Uncharacterized protein n=1 Tax=Littorina saxatilis TaxID=31220 RepID=A0AAN9AV84_9CAEN
MATTLQRVLFTLAIVVTVSQAAPSRSSKCPSRCVSCSNGIAECSKRSLITPPKDFPSGIRTIVMDNNHLRVLGTRSFQKLGNVEVLRLKGNKVRVVKKAAFAKLPKLMTLDLSNNQLVKIYSKGFEGMRNLQTLSLQDNRIRSIARIFDYTPRLFQLNLAFNKLRAIGKNDLKVPTRIHYLDLRDNRITKIHPEAFLHLETLRYLFLNKNPLVTVPDMKFSTNVLQLVDFDNCKLTHVPTTMPSSVSDFRLSDNNIMQINDTDFANMTHLRLLALNNNQLHFVANRALDGLTGLEELWLRNNKLVYVPRRIPDNLQKLYMDSNMIQEIEDGLFTNTSRLHYINVENNKINGIHNQTFKGLRFLKSVNFRSNRLRVIESGTFSALRNLSTLSLSNNPLEKIEDGAFHDLGNLTSLHLDMCGERITLEQNFLPEMPNLKTLSMMNSPGLGKAFVKMIEETPMVPLKHLKDVDLTYNDIHTMSPNIQEVFPALDALSIDGNSWLCDTRLAWLRDWMVHSDIKFSKYEPVICEQPYTLKSREIRDLDADEFAEVAPEPQTPSQEEYDRMMRDKSIADNAPVADAPADNLRVADSLSDKPQAADGNNLVPYNMREDPALAAVTPIGPTTPAPESPTTKRLRKHRKHRKGGKKRGQRKGKGKGRKRRGKKGKGRKRRNKNSKDANTVVEKST